MSNRHDREEELLQRLGEIKEDLRQRKTNMKCGDVCSVLIDLGFDIKDCKRGGHKIYTHDHLPSFFSDGLNCGHGRDDKVKEPYINKIIKHIDAHEDDLIEFLKWE